MPYGITATRMPKLHEKLDENDKKARTLFRSLFEQLTITLQILDVLWIHNY